jgi:hypothetical protein
MDAPEDQDYKLHRASSRLLSDLAEQLPELLSEKGKDGTYSPRLWVRIPDINKLEAHLVSLSLSINVGDF